MKPYILAEIASAHMGDPKLCSQLIHKARESGANGVKVQIWYPEEGDFNHMLDKYFDWSGMLQKAPRGFELWGQYYGHTSKKVCEKYCDRLIDGKTKISKNLTILGWQDYPTKLEDRPLKDVYRALTGPLTEFGYADHTAADSEFRFIIPAMAMAAGATVIEKHICLNRLELKEKSKDWVSALEPDEFKEFVEFMHKAGEAL